MVRVFGANSRGAQPARRGRTGNRGSNTKKTTRQSTSAPIPNLPTSQTQLNGATNGVGDKCSFCSVSIGADSVGCDKCERWFCPSTMCLGVPDNVVRSFLGEGGDAILFVCTECRISESRGSPSSSQGLASQQMLQTIKGLCTTISSLVQQVAMLQQNVTSLLSAGGSTGGGSQSQSDPSSQAVIRESIREEVREVREREKRKDSVIIRGVARPDQVPIILNDVSHHLLGRSVVFSDIKTLDSSRSIYRCKIFNDKDRTDLLSKTRELRNNDNFKTIFINRDLTWNQRQKLFADRQRRSNPDDSHDGTANSNPQSTTPILPAHPSSSQSSHLN